ncbi:hypothetical protein DXD54_08590 [Clostridium sp. TM06-18]|nr:hypothetical protein DXD54_08590 [Clostridium sp. TM06-18]
MIAFCEARFFDFEKMENEKWKISQTHFCDRAWEKIFSIILKFCQTYSCIRTFTKSHPSENSINGTSCCRIHSTRNLKNRKLGTPSG